MIPAERGLNEVAILGRRGVPPLAAQRGTVCCDEGWFSCLYGCMFCEVELESSLGLVRIFVLDYSMVRPVVVSWS